jgi:hypothetical protein
MPILSVSSIKGKPDMQLFQLSKEQLKHVGRVVNTIRDSKKGDTVLTGLEIPLVQYAISDKPGEIASGESRQFSDIDLTVAVEDDGHIDGQKIMRGVEDFVSSALFFAFNPLKGREGEVENPSVSLQGHNDDDGKVALGFEKIDVARFGVTAAAEAIDQMEQLMFSKWRPAPDEKGMLRKRFSSAAECDRVVHLMVCMGEAIGYTQDDINKAFSEPPDERTLVVHKDFLALLAKVEQSLEADFGTRRH